MHFDATVDGRAVRLEVLGGPERYTVAVDGRVLSVDLRESSSGFVNLLLEGRSYDLGLERRPASGRRRNLRSVRAA